MVSEANYQYRILVLKLNSTGLYFLGEMVTKQPLIRSMRTVKRETLKLISGWVSRSNDPQMVSEMLHFLLKLMLYFLMYAYCLIKGNFDWIILVSFLESLNTFSIKIF